LRLSAINGSSSVTKNPTLCHLKARHHKTLSSFLFTVFSLLFITFSNVSSASTFYLRPPSSDIDKRYLYESDIFILALEKTRQEFGDYTLAFGPKMNNLRAVDYIQKNKLSNFFVLLNHDIGQSRHDLIHIPFPIHLGIVGYRVCFSSSTTLNKLKGVSTLEDLRAFTFALGRGWGDVAILKHNGLEVVELDNYQSLFKMTATSRIDLFCRGAHEFLTEQQAISGRINLSLEPDLLLYYPYPRFLYTHTNNKKNADRIYLGLQRAFDDGSLQKAWSKYFSDSVASAGLNQRKLLTLTNPLIEKDPGDYMRYMINPFDLPPLIRNAGKKGTSNR